MTIRVQSTLHPWALGPFELIKQAHGHFNDGGDTDRRIALIGFDNAIEVCIDVFIRLHPKLRKVYTIPREESENALRNYHSKIEFLDKHIEIQNMPTSIQVETILWYHQLRNELYYSGNGMVPELHVVAGAHRKRQSKFSKPYLR